MIGVTGASGHLGQALLALLPDAYPIGRTLPDIPLAGIIHAAAPDYRDDEAVILFHDFNIALQQYIHHNHIRRVVIVGSWWQFAEGEARQLLYTLMKDHQRRMFPGTHVIPYSIYGDEARPGRGFIPQLIHAINGSHSLTGLSDQPRDFIHVTDVARACVIALDVPRGTYTAATLRSETPRQIAARYGITAPDYTEHPTATPRYPVPQVPAWRPLITTDDHIRHACRLGR